MPCHAERSEASLCPSSQTLSAATGDKRGQQGYALTIHGDTASQARV
jgi:hypothetical protein